MIKKYRYFLDRFVNLYKFESTIIKHIFLRLWMKRVYHNMIETLTDLRNSVFDMKVTMYFVFWQWFWHLIYRIPMYWKYKDISNFITRLEKKIRGQYLNNLMIFRRRYQPGNSWDFWLFTNFPVKLNCIFTVIFLIPDTVVIVCNDLCVLFLIKILRLTKGSLQLLEW